MKRDYEILVVKKMELQKTYKKAQKEVRDMEKRLDNIKQYLNHKKTLKTSIPHKINHSL